VHALDLTDGEADFVLAWFRHSQLFDEVEESPAGQHGVLADDDGGEHRATVRDFVLIQAIEHLPDLRREMRVVGIDPDEFGELTVVDELRARAAATR
jgi:hypothetical protein